METVVVVPRSKDLKGTEKRDSLIAIEKKYQQQWQEDKVFESNAPSTSEIPTNSIAPAVLRQKYPKFFGTMAYPYMNGTLHAGHSFSVSKIEFATGFARMQGKRALFPMGFHCTGMPIKAAADKLAAEVKLFGEDFEGYKDSAVAAEPVEQPREKAKSDDVTKIVAKKGKAASKVLKMNYQFQIMRAIGIPNNEIHRFADPLHWLEFFPPLCQRDLTNLGTRIDWRRSFVTTDANPYYDAFVRWQMNRLKDLDKIKFGKRYTIYSAKDQQPCMDHDRASDGEGALPQQYTAVKLKVKEWAPQAASQLQSKIPADANVYFVSATLRPETLYGQTCCFVSPTITYGVFKASVNEYFVITDRAALNMSYQRIFEQNGVSDKVAELTGLQCIGTVVHAPMSVHGAIRILPMDSISSGKGTGVVSSVPSDSPDDFITMADLAKKADYYGIQKEWAELEIIPIIDTPSFGNLTAAFLVQKLKISSPKDTKQLEEAKELAYKESFYQGTMTFGDFKGEKVESAKPKIRQQLVDAGDAFDYSEPERKVMSRSGDECCVALLDQWYIDYGEEKWRATAIEHVTQTMQTYTAETRNGFEGVLNWLNQWACARSFGLGSRLPWDPQFLVESLSDSTIYMAYYTVAHYLHADVFGKTPGLAGITADQMTDEVWDYIFTRRDMDETLSEKSEIPKATLESMRREFEYWYPLDLRVSGKDLIPNHLTFFIYIHIAIFPPEYWPRGVRANGHLLLNGEKMAKSTGNFMTLDDIVKKYGADASRIAFADAGDGVTDANFEEDVADTSILRLFTLREWCKDQVADHELRSGAQDSFLDALFDNEMNTVVNEAREQYEATNYKLALKAALYDLTSARDFYREFSIAINIKMHRDLVLKYIELQALLLAVIAPHWSEHIWLEVLKKSTTIHNQLWPVTAAVDPVLTATREYIRAVSSNITSAEAAAAKRKAKGKSVQYDPQKPKKLTIYTAAEFPQWQEQYVDLIRQSWNAESHSFTNEEDLTKRIVKSGDAKKAMPFVQGLKRRLVNGETAEQVLNRRLVFDENHILREIVPAIKRTAGVSDVDIVSVAGNGKSGILIGGQEDKPVDELAPMAANAVPGVPAVNFENIEV